MVVKVVGGVDGEKYGDYGRMFKTVWVPVKIMVTGSNGVEGGSKGGNVNQISNRPVLLETSKNVII